MACSGYQILVGHKTLKHSFTVGDGVLAKLKCVIHARLLSALSLRKRDRSPVQGDDNDEHDSLLHRGSSLRSTTMSTFPRVIRGHEIMVHRAQSLSRPPMSLMGPKADETAPICGVGFSPESGHCLSCFMSTRPKCATLNAVQASRRQAAGPSALAERWYADRAGAGAVAHALALRQFDLVWRFRSPHHFCRELVMRTSEQSHTRRRGQNH